MFELPDDIAEREPVRQTAVGPVWELAGTELGLDAGPMLVRELREPRDLLTTGAVLRLAANHRGRHLGAAAYWARRGEEVWIASPRPHGVPFGTAPRLAFGEALEVWRPLAEALVSAHRAGAMHGSVGPDATWWDEEARRLSVVDFGTWVGDAIPRDSVWWAPELRAPTRERRPTIASDIYGLGRLLLAIVLGRDEAARETPNFSIIPAYAIPGLERALAADPMARPQRIAELLTALAPSPRRARSDERTKPGKDILYGRVHGVEKLEHPRHGKGVKFFVTYPEYDEHGHPIEQRTTGAFFYESRGRDIYEGLVDIWDGAELNLLDAEVIEDSSGTTYLTSRPETLPVLEPHWPVTVTNVLKADGCVSKYFVDLRDPGPPSRPLVLGSMLHGMLDDLARSHEKPPTFEESFDTRFPTMRMGMIAAGLGDDDYERFRDEARRHFDHIAGYAAGRDAARRERVGWSGENVEVTRYSSMYGLEGRIDLVTEEAKVGLHIVELKSGSERDEHVSQLRCYRLLWDGVAERQEMKIHGSLLYSRSGLMRSAPEQDLLRERRILRARNQLVAAHKAIAEGAESFALPFYLQIPENCHEFCRWRKPRCREQTLTLGLGGEVDPNQAAAAGTSPWQGFAPHVVDRALLYWRHFSRLVELENWGESEAIGRILQSGRLRERVASHEAVAKLRLAHIDVASGEVTFEGDVPKIFSGSDAVVAHRGDFHTQHILRGSFVSSDSRTLKIWTQGAPNATALARDGWIVDRLPVRVGHRAAYRAMYGFLHRRDDRLLTILLDPRSKRARELCSPATDEVSVSEQSRAVLNDAQVEAVHWGLTTHGGCLIQGPPGTGKTTVIAHLIRELVADGRRVIVSAQTNTAVDTVLQAVADVGVRSFLRVGHSNRSPALAAHLVALGEDPHEYFSRDVGEATESLDELARRVAYTSVVGCTTHRAVSDDIINFLTASIGEVPFDVAIVDEATQISEPMTLSPLRLAHRFVLVGDHRQLPPIVSNERATTANVEAYNWFEVEDRAAPQVSDTEQLGLFQAEVAPALDPIETPIGLGGLDRSLFERLVEEGLPYVMLEEQYRMHEKVQAFSSRAYYDERLHPHESVARRTLTLDADTLASQPENVRRVLDASHPVVFCHVDGTANYRTNEAEADAVVETARALLECGPGLTRQSIGIVTPFRAQGELIRSKLRARLPERADEIQVDTVERYQGSERDTIIVSLVKTENAGEFLSDHRRVNVTLTRARKKLILFGHRECLLMSPLFRQLIEQDETLQTRW